LASVWLLGPGGGRQTTKNDGLSHPLAAETGSTQIPQHQEKSRLQPELAAPRFVQDVAEVKTMWH
jgi:hypothetical protein